MALATGTRFDRYEILAPLGRGGMGEVYLALDTRLKRQVALKLLPAEVASDPDRTRRFLREAKAASALSHPNICMVHEVGETAEGQFFIVMEYVEGQTLAAKIGSRPMEAAKVLALGLQLADALEEAQAKGVTHRDLKPQNVMLTPRGQVKVLDFGLAKITRAERPAASDITTDSGTAPGVVMGTVQYMSPEQALGREVDHRTDLFALGVVLYEMATGRLPFTGPTTSATLDQILHAEPEAMARFNSQAPAELERIVRKCLEKDRERRYQSARELLVDLRNLQRDSSAGASQKAAARPAGVVRRFALASLAAVLMVAGVGLYWLAGRDQAISSVAVLPFVNVNADPNTEYLSDGIPENIIISLSQLPKLKVMSRNSVLRYKGREIDTRAVGRELGVRAVLMGRVAQRGHDLSVSVELVDAQDNSHLWGQRYNRKLADVFAVQEEIAREISEKLRLKLTGGEKRQLAKRYTENVKAFQYYMQGRSYADRRTREDVLTAIRHYDKAIEEDNNYALAYAGLADAYAGLGVRSDLAPIEGRRKAEEAARKAFALDENLAEAHLALGQVCTRFVPYNFSLGDRELRRAIELSPSLALAHNYLGYSLARQGRLDESFGGFLKARELDPLSPIIARGVAFPYYLKRDYLRALEELQQANKLGPTFSTTWEIGIYLQNRRFTEALAELEKARQERKNDSLLIYSTGVAYAAQGKRPAALQIIKELEAMSGASLSQAHWIAKIYAALNEQELALAWLERGLGTGAMGAFYKDDPIWDPIRRAPRFADLLRRMGITP
jgi:serine/threonine-protein kinase